MADLSQTTALLKAWVINPALWLVLILVFALGVFVILYIRKKRQLKFPTIELVDLGSGKVAMNVIKSGFYGRKLYLNGLWWGGEEVLRTGTGEIIESFSTEDFQEVDGVRGVVCYRDPLNQNILVPINKAKFNNKELVADIAPASYRDVAVDIFNETVKETSDFKEKIIQFLGWALVVIFSLIAIIVIVQMVKNGQSESKDLLLQAGAKGAEACKNICSDALNIVASKGSGSTAP